MNNTFKTIEVISLDNLTTSAEQLEDAFELAAEFQYIHEFLNDLSGEPKDCVIYFDEYDGTTHARKALECKIEAVEDALLIFAKIIKSAPEGVLRDIRDIYEATNA